MENKLHVSWLELFCTAIPFLLYLAVPIIEVLRFNLGGVGSLSLLGVIFVSLIVGLVKGLPRWSLPTMGLLLAILNYLVLGIITAILITFTVIPIELSRELFGSGFMYIGVLPLSLIIILVTALIKPLHPFFQRIRNDWTLFSFALYGIMPMVIFLSFAEYQGSVPYEIGLGLVLLVGLWLYLRITQLGRKLLVLGIGITLAMAIEAIGKWMLIPSQSWVDLLQPYSVEQTIQGEVTITIYTWFWVMVVVFLPAVLGLLPRPTRLTPAKQP